MLTLRQRHHRHQLAAADNATAGAVHCYSDDSNMSWPLNSVMSADVIDGQLLSLCFRASVRTTAAAAESSRQGNPATTRLDTRTYPHASTSIRLIMHHHGSSWPCRSGAGCSAFRWYHDPGWQCFGFELSDWMYCAGAWTPDLWNRDFLRRRDQERVPRRPSWQSRIFFTDCCDDADDVDAGASDVRYGWGGSCRVFIWTVKYPSAKYSLWHKRWQETTKLLVLLLILLICYHWCYLLFLSSLILLLLLTRFFISIIISDYWQSCFW